jgi:hypothetical protein
MSACRPGEFMTDEFWRWQACDLAQAIRTRRISSREAVMSCLARLARRQSVHQRGGRLPAR